MHSLKSTQDCPHNIIKLNIYVTNPLFKYPLKTIKKAFFKNINNHFDSTISIKKIERWKYQEKALSVQIFMLKSNYYVFSHKTIQFS